VATDRKFAAFNRDGREGLGIPEIPEDGLCISVFLILRQSDSPRRVLMGHLNPEAPWDHIGALTKDRIEAHSHGWMLPSCHILYGESPTDAVARIGREQLGFADAECPSFSGPAVYSEVYTPRRHPERGKHWDLEFVFEGKLGRERFASSDPSKLPPAWTRLEFVDIDSTPKSEIARSHEDILARLD
jgi:ADP-ribose pyrophosphatase YjhB (NUDIX family)